MGWDFETDAGFQKELDWMDTFVREEVEPLDYVFDDRTTRPIGPRCRSFVRSSGK